MALISRGFKGRRRESAQDLPPGQYVTRDFPVFSAGPTPRIPTEQWSFAVVDLDGRTVEWTWEEFQALPSETITTDIHCVTRWSKLGTVWEGVSVDRLLEGIETRATHAMAYCDGGYTANLPLAHLTGGKAWIAYDFDGAPLAPEHGAPARLLVPHLYLWKSAKWVRGLRLMDHDERGFWEQLGYHDLGDPWREQRHWGD
jgi:DMSO/TMAO reductase YedYZ molybdopterin-dependent catalytic subunit